MDLGGGIAAYAAVFLMGVYFVAPHIYPAVRTIHVRGTLHFSAAPPKLPDVHAEFHPPDLAVREGGTFDWPVTLVNGTEYIVVHPSGYEGQTLFLAGEVPFGAPNYKHHFDAAGNLIFDEPIVFKPLSQGGGLL